MFKQTMLFLISGFLLLAAQLAPAAAQSTASPLIMIDFVVMNEGYGMKERDIYDVRAVPIAARYGIKRLASLNVFKKLTWKGFRAERVDLWQLPSLKALQAWANDAEYKTLLPYRNRVHDMRALSLYFANPAFPVPAIGQGHYFIEFIRAAPGFDSNLFADYEKKADSIASGYGVRRIASLNISKKLQGQGPDGQRLNIWKLTTEKGFLSWGRSAEFKGLDPMRHKLFDRPNYLMMVGKTR